MQAQRVHLTRKDSFRDYCRIKAGRDQHLISIERRVNDSCSHLLLVGVFGFHSLLRGIPLVGINTIVGGKLNAITVECQPHAYGHILRNGNTFFLSLF